MQPVITATDMQAIKALLTNASDPDYQVIRAELARAKVVGDHHAGEKVVRLNSVVDVAFLDMNQVRTVAIVLPGHANMKSRKISVLSPLGAALLGRAEDEQVDCILAGKRCALKLLKVVNPGKEEKDAG